MSSANKVDVRIIHLVNGYVRILNITTQIIPRSIINLLIKFYQCRSKIIYIQHNSLLNESNTPPIIAISELDKNKNYESHVYLINKSMKKDIKYNANRYCGICFVKDFKIPCQTFNIIIEYE